MSSMEDMLKKFEVLIEFTEISRVIVSANSSSAAQEVAVECVRRGDVESSKYIGERCVGVHEVL